MVKTIVMLSVAFLLGGIIAVAYFTFFSGTNVENDKNVNIRAKYTMSVGENNYYSIKTIDSLTAATNYPVTVRNKVVRFNPDSTNAVNL